MSQDLKCPLCGAAKINFFCNKNNYQLYNCSVCGLGFVWPIPAETEEIYSEQYFKKSGAVAGFGYVDYERDKEPMRQNFIKCLAEIEELTSGRKIFDVGTATGYFLDLAAERGWQTAGAEISPFAADLAVQKGHDIFLGKLENFVPKNNYDVVTMWDVLEHLDAPQKYLRAINRMLSENGILVINTINKECLWARLWGKRWHAIIPPEHLFYWSPFNLKALLTEQGFLILASKTIGKQFSSSYVFKTLADWQNLRVWHKLSNFFNSKFWRGFGLPINLGDNIFVVAKKIKEV